MKNKNKILLYPFIIFSLLSLFLMSTKAQAQSISPEITFIKLTDDIGYIIDADENDKCKCVTNYNKMEYNFAALIQLKDSSIVLRIMLVDSLGIRDIEMGRTEVAELITLASAINKLASDIDTIKEKECLKVLVGDATGSKYIEYYMLKFPELIRTDDYVETSRQNTSKSLFHFRSNYLNANKMLHETKNIQTKPFLKAHFKNGDVCILKDSWKIDTDKNILSGNGILYDFNRNQTFSGIVSIPIDSVVIFETNKKILDSETERIATLCILTAVDLVIGVICLTNPKACFGSCPTFYINETDNFHYADAEGFSSAIAPSMEYFDIDALNNKPIEDHLFSITMKSEALETHCVNQVKLLAYPRKKNERIYQSSTNDFYLCENNYSISKATGNEGDITNLLQHADKQERFSLADENNLIAKEEVFLSFENLKNHNDLGLIVNFRQTLMTTYLLYSAIGYMGNQVSDIFAKLESNKQINNKLKEGIFKELGNIDIYLWNEMKNTWEFQNGLYETGPIAINRQILPLKNISLNSNVKIKLVMNKGYWRLDYLALTNIIEKAEPFEIKPVTVLNKGKIDNTALTSVIDPHKYLISMPGSEYRFNFFLPLQNDDYELFLYTKGYYLEWMREHWIKDKNLLKLKQMFENPKRYLKVDAKHYKLYEHTMEQEFWNSKINTKSFSYYEN